MCERAVPSRRCFLRRTFSQNLMEMRQWIKRISEERKRSPERTKEKLFEVPVPHVTKEIFIAEVSL